MNENYQIMWAVGPELFDIVKMDLESEKIDIEKLKNIQAVPYIYNMTEVLNICDIAVCRSGAMTVTELEKLAKPAIFIPFPYAAENHQEFNARALEKQNAARVILDKDLTAEKLNAEIEDMISDKENLKQMSINCGKQSMEDVEDAIYREIKVS
jgi:UDP-N-acetylglucosamine--N-acetylmuramyl-(pentapeptide) pyrophosphoryl-undecaprenol N-acetylglucosamine transferase